MESCLWFDMMSYILKARPSLPPEFLFAMDANEVLSAYRLLKQQEAQCNSRSQISN